VSSGQQAITRCGRARGRPNRERMTGESRCIPRRPAGSPAPCQPTGEQEPLQLVEITWSEGLVAVQALHGETGLMMMQRGVDPQTDRRSS
jgi:hypothetical protein